MAHPSIFATEQKKENPILIIDKKGIIGERLADKLIQESTVMLVSGKNIFKHEKIMHIPFVKSFPVIPENIYSHIIVVDEYLQLNKKFINNIFKKALENNTGVFFGINHECLTEKIFSETVLKYQNLKLGILGDIFATNIIYNEENQINKMILSVKTKGKVYIPSDATETTPPVLLEDLIDSILEICFSSQKDRIYYVLPKTPVTRLTLATIIKKNFPEVKLDFYKTKKEKKKKNISLTGNYVFGDDYNLSDKIKTINFGKIKEDGKINTVKNKRHNNSVLFTILFLLILLALPLITTFTFNYFGKVMIVYTENYLKQGENIKAEHVSNLSQNLLFVTVASGSLLKEELEVFGQEDLANVLSSDATNNYLLSRAYYNFTKFLNKLNSVFSGESDQAQQDFKIAVMFLNNSNINFNITQNMKFSGGLAKELTGIYGLTSATINLWPEVLGFNGKKTYLIYYKTDSKKGFTEEQSQYSIFQMDKGRIVNGALSSTPSGMLSQLITTASINGIIEIDSSFMNQLQKHINKNNLITIDFLDFIKNELKEKHIMLSLDNPLLQTAILSNIN